MSEGLRCPPPPPLNATSPVPTDEFKGHSLLQAAREADMAKVKKTLALEIISFKHPQTNDTALVRTGVSQGFSCGDEPSEGSTWRC